MSELALLNGSERFPDDVSLLALKILPSRNAGVESKA